MKEFKIGSDNMKFIFKKTIYLLLLTVCIHKTLKAEDIVELVHVAFKNSYEFQANIEKYNSMYANKDLALSYILPTIDVTGNIDYTVSSTTYSATDTKVNNNIPNKGLSISLVQPIINLQALAGYKASQLAAQSAIIQLNKDRNSIVLKTADLYFKVLSSMDDLEYIKTNKKYLEEQMAEVTQQIKVGKARSLDIESTKSKYDIVLYQEIMYENALKINLENMNKFLNTEVQFYKKVKDKIENIHIEEHNLEAWKNLSQSGNLDVLLSEISLKLSKTDLQAKTASYYPTLSFIASQGLKKTIEPQMNDTDSLSNNSFVGLQLNMNLFSGGKDYTERKQKAYNLKENEYNVKNLNNQINTLTTQYYLAVYSGLAQIESLEQSVIAAEKFLNAARKGYEVGLQANSDVLDATDIYFNSKRSLSKAKYEFLLSILSLKSIAGIIEMNDVEQLNTYLE
jgi:outer membrane protein